jgi:hypothetical protein
VTPASSVKKSRNVEDDLSFSSFGSFGSWHAE